MPFLGVIFQVLAIIRAARSKKPNVIYCRLMEFPGAVAGKILGIPTVVAEINNPRKSLEIKYKFLGNYPFKLTNLLFSGNIIS